MTSYQAILSGCSLAWLTMACRDFFAGFKGKTQWLGLVLATIAMVGGYALGSTLMNGWAAALPEIFTKFHAKYGRDDCRIYLSQSIKKIK